MALFRKKIGVEYGEVLGDKGYRIRESKLDSLLWDIEVELIQADVAHEVITEILNGIRDEILSGKIKRGIAPEKAVEFVIRNEILRILGKYSGKFLDIALRFPSPRVVLFVGVNGTGKTTTIAKVAYYLQRHGYSSVFAASDTFRAGAIEQIEEHGKRLGIRVIKHRAGADPAAVAYDAVEHARARGKDFVLIDTAGRMQTNRNLMDELAKIKRVARPHITVFVGDALTGNDAVEQARMFNNAIGVDGIILTKLDADVKGGAVLSISWVIKKPIFFVSIGQEYEEFMEFNPDWMVDKLLGAG
ncbi:MAG: signal recognition particle-docking protein FtsY [Thermoplasmata archaeon]|nr:MAG: signal recognition particle-docking protein FtsY [Thermoplasmata archaeon]